VGAPEYFFRGRGEGIEPPAEDFAYFWLKSGITITSRGGGISPSASAWI